MKPRKRIVIDVRTDGTMVAATHNIKGQSCLDEVARIEALSGERVTTSRLTDDFYEPEVIETVMQQTQLQEDSP